MEHHQMTAEPDTAAVSPRRGAVVRQILNALETARSAGEVARIVGKPTCYVTGNLNRLLRQGYVSRISRGTYIAVAGTGNPENDGPKPDKHRLDPEIVSYLAMPRTVQEITDRFGIRSRTRVAPLSTSGRIVRLNDGRYVARERAGKSACKAVPHPTFATQKEKVLACLETERTLCELTAFAGGSEKSTEHYVRDYIHSGVVVKVRHGVFIRADRLPLEERERLRGLGCWTTESALQSLLSHPMTTKELAARTGGSRNRIGVLIRKLQDEGRVVSVPGRRYVSAASLMAD